MTITKTPTRKERRLRRLPVYRHKGVCLKAVEELVLNMLAELSTTSITKAKDPQNLEENMQCAAEGGEVARVAREQLESKTGRNVVSPLSGKRFFEAQESPELLGEADEK